MNTPNWNDLNVGDALPVHEAGPISRTTLALFAGGSGDHNPIHLDSDLAKSAGYPDVFAQGMLSMAYLAQLLTKWVPQETLRSYGVRFTSITPVDVTVKAEGKVIDKFEADGEKHIKVEVWTTLDNGTETLRGDAVIALPA